MRRSHCVSSSNVQTQINIMIVKFQPRFQTLTMTNTRPTNKHHNSLKLSVHQISIMILKFQTSHWDNDHESNALKRLAFPVWSTSDTDWDSHKALEKRKMLITSMMGNWAKCMYDGEGKKFVRPKIRNLNWCWSLRWSGGDQSNYCTINLQIWAA